MADLVEKCLGENQQLNELEDRIRDLEERVRISMAVEVTGTERDPIYARGSFDRHGGYSKWKPDLWRVSLSSQAPCRLSNLRDLEVWVCGTKLPGHPLNFTYGQDSEVLLGMNFASTSIWVNLGWTLEEIEERKLNFDSTRQHVMDHVNALAQADPERHCAFTDLYQRIEYSLPLVHSTQRVIDVDALVSDRDTVVESLQNMGVFGEMRLSLDPVGDRLMITIRDDGVDVYDQEALQTFLTNYGTQRLLGDRLSFEEEDGPGLNAL